MSMSDVAGISYEELEAILQECCPPTAGGTNMAASMLLKSRARRLLKACKLVLGLEWTAAATEQYNLDRESNAPEAYRAAAAPAPAVTAAIVNKTRTMKMSEIADVTRSDDVAIISKARADDGIKLYATLMHRPPKPDEDPTQEQLSVLEERLHSDTCYVDMGLCGRHGNRTQRAMKCEGLVLEPDNQLVRKQFHGPPDFAHWEACWRVFATVMLMLDQCLPPVLDAYYERIARFSNRCGHNCWALIYQVGCRMRREHLEILRRAESADLNEAIAQGRTHPFNPTKPWATLFKRAVADYGYATGTNT